jgi:hypothetical protein
VAPWFKSVQSGIDQDRNGEDCEFLSRIRVIRP